MSKVRLNIFLYDKGVLQNENKFVKLLTLTGAYVKDGIAAAISVFYWGNG
ncbi:hypothetical protein IEC97_28750 [Neobacillus cucumis]|nr:hypothetical protein [Neobacillus cucumis]MBI0581307.1 hypothetical protein [Neobacillus cucumis]